MKYFQSNTFSDFGLSCCPIFYHFRGSCCVKITKNSPKSTFIKLFELIMNGNIFYFLFSYEICIIDCLFNVFICHPGPCNHFLDPFRGSCCVKITKNSSKSTFIKLFDLNTTRNVVYFLCLYEICIVDCFFNVFICHFGPCDPYLDPFRGCVMSK